jgi:hypothetical protein
MECINNRIVGSELETHLRLYYMMRLRSPQYFTKPYLLFPRPVTVLGSLLLLFLLVVGVLDGAVRGGELKVALPEVAHRKLQQRVLAVVRHLQDMTALHYLEKKNFVLSGLKIIELMA